MIRNSDIQIYVDITDNYYQNEIFDMSEHILTFTMMHSIVNTPLIMNMMYDTPLRVLQTFYVSHDSIVNLNINGEIL